jgi:DEAD/DEAH box helicase domain-containing protein
MSNSQKEDEEIVRNILDNEFDENKKSSHKVIFNSDYVVKKDSFENNEDKFLEALNFYDSGNLTYAKEICNDLLNEDKNDANALYLIGAILNKQEDKNGAVGFLKKAIKINPSHIEANELLIELEK